MKSNLLPRTYEAPNPGPPCLECRSKNTSYFGGGYWTCLDCLEMFRGEDLLAPQLNPAKLMAYTKDGSHWYLKTDDTLVLIPKEVMKECEDLHIRPEHGMPGYDPISSYNWAKICEEIDQRALAEKLFGNLTPEQIEQLRRQLNV